MRDALRLSSALCLVLVSTTLYAASIQSIHVETQSNAYHVKAHVVMTASQKTAFAAATDLAQLPAYSPAIKSERLLGHHKVASKMHLCVAFFCRTIHQVMRYSTQPPTRLDMQVVRGAAI